MESLKDKSESTELFKSKRTEYAVEIRKKKNDELINIKRFKCMSTKQDQKSLEEIVMISLSSPLLPIPLRVLSHRNC